MPERLIAGIRQPVLSRIARPILAALRRHHTALNERIHDWDDELDSRVTPSAVNAAQGCQIDGALARARRKLGR